MKKYISIFKTELATAIEYRAVPLTWALAELISLASILFLWVAVFRDRASVGQYNFGQMMFYYSLIPLIGVFTYPYISSSLPRRIKDGRISSDLLRPHNLTIAAFLRSISINITQVSLKAPIFLGVFIWLSRVFDIGFDFKSLGLALLICVFSYILHFFIDLCLSYAAFWMDLVWSLEHLKLLAVMIFGGLIFPLSLLPANLQSLFNFLPFRFFYYFPISIAQGVLSFEQILTGILQILAWILFFYLFSKILWKQGLKKYGAYGG